MKFWVVHNIPSPYRLHIFNALWQECIKRGLDFHVHFMSDMSRGYDERPISWRNPHMDFPHTYWRDYGFGQHHFNPGLLWYLKKEQPDYLFAGSPVDTFTGMLAGRMIKGVSCTWCEGNTKTPGKMTGLKAAIKHFAWNGFDYSVVPGHDAVRYLDMHRKYTRLRLARPVLLPNLVDESRFCGVHNPSIIDSKLKKAIIPARLLPVKGLLEFISILTPNMVKGWLINIVGDGPLKEQIFTLISKNGLGDCIKIMPFVAYDDMPRLYAESDLLILPSVYDPNPLSVVEALHSGLPIALSERAGNVEEAVTPGKNGWVLPVGDKTAYEATLRQVFAAPIGQLREMGAYSKARNAQFWNTEKCVRDFVDVIIGAKS